MPMTIDADITHRKPTGILLLSDDPSVGKAPVTHVYATFGGCPFSILGPPGKAPKVLAASSEVRRR